MPVCDCVFLRLVVMMQTLAADGALSVGCQNSSGCRRVEVTGASLFGMSCISALVVVSCCDAGLLALRRAALAALAALVTSTPQRWRNGAAMSLAVLSMLLQDHSRSLLSAKLTYALHPGLLVPLHTASSRVSFAGYS